MDIVNFIKNKQNKNINFNEYKSINKSNWIILWAKKIDYIEYQMFHIEGKYKSLQKSVNYYIGMCELAISYINDIGGQNEAIKEELVISHRRIKCDYFNNPLNIIIDYKSRDIAEYLKYLFVKNIYDYYKIKEMLLSLRLNNISCRLIYGRMFFITFYFDLYDNILNGESEEKEIDNITNRVEEYEDYIRNIYSILNEIYKIPEISID